MQSKPLVFARLVVLLRLQMPCSSAVLIRSCPLQRSGTMAIPRQAIAGPVGGSGLSLPHHQDDKYYIGYAVRRQPTAPSDSCPQTLKTISDHLPMHRGVLVMLTGIPFPTAPHWRNSRIQSTPPGCCAVALPPPCAGGFLRPAPAAASLCSWSCRVSCSIVRRCCLRRPATNCTMRGIPVSTVPHWINWRQPVIWGTHLGATAAGAPRRHASQQRNTRHCSSD